MTLYIPRPTLIRGITLVDVCPTGAVEKKGDIKSVGLWAGMERTETNIYTVFLLDVTEKGAFRVTH